MLNANDNFTLNSIFWPKAFIKKKHAIQYQLHSLCSTILNLFILMRYVHVDVMSRININKFKLVEQRLCN